MKKLHSIFAASFALLLVTSQIAQAHVSFVANNAYQGKSYNATMNVGHGCEVESDIVGGDPEYFDTVKIEVEIPVAFTIENGKQIHSGLSSVKPADMPFFTANVTTDNSADKNVTKITWTKDAAAKAARTSDMALYQPTFRAKLPNLATSPVTTLEFRTTQTCLKNGNEITLVWEGEEAPKLNILPTRFNGWNKYTAQADINLTTLQTFFTDAEIVWSERRLFSSNPVTNTQITSPLTVIPTGTEYWVKY